MIDVTIDGRALRVAPGTTLLEAALAHGIDIPHLCYHPELSVAGGCRLCLVEIEGQDQPTPACGLLCRDGLAVRTQSELLRELRREMIDLFVSDHPLDCVTCDAAGACRLQHYAYEYGVTRTSYDFESSRALYQDDNPFFVRDHQYCILCGRCVRVCSEVVGADAIDIVGRGFTSYVATPFDRPLDESTCVFCGSCVQVCPTAALLPVARRGRGREWELDRTRTTCGYCGVGCQIEYAHKDGAIRYASGAGTSPSTTSDAVNGELLCVKGRFGWDFATHPDRLTQPLLRRDVAYDLGLTADPWELPERSPLADRKPDISASHVPVNWDTALDLAADRLATVIAAHGPDAVMGLSSARCTNEENYLFQKFMRAGVGTNNVDHCARL